MEKKTTSNLSPIVLFSYARPKMLEQTLGSLKQNLLISESELYIFCDGAKPNATSEQIKNIEAVRALAKQFTYSKKTIVIESPTNKGLANSIIEGVTRILAEYKKIIVVEDDVLLSPYFLTFMNDALNVYQNEIKVSSIGSWNYYCDSEKIKGNFFLRYPDTIAWATWERAWNIFESDSIHLQEELQKTRKMRAFNIDGASSFFSDTLQSQIEGRVDSWAIRWTASTILNNMLTLYPQYCLSKHIGFGEGATHETGGDKFDTGVELYNNKVNVKSIPIAESKLALNSWKVFLVGLENKHKLNLIKNKIKKHIPSKALDIIRSIKNFISPQKK